MKAFVSCRLGPKWLDKLQEKFDVDYYNWIEKGLLPAEDFQKRMQEADIVITESDEISAEMIDASPNVKMIISCRGTVVNVDLEAATRNGIVVINTPGRNAFAVADLTVAMMVMVARNLIPGSEALRRGDWHANGRRWAYVTYQGCDLKGKTVGLLGLGHIGRLTAERLVGFGVKLIGYDPYLDPKVAEELGVELVSLDEAFKQSDFLSLHVPLMEKTKGMITRRELKLMKPTSYFINTSRAAVVVEEDLIECLQEKWIAGAALDVYHEEPLPADYPLLHMEHVICTPHLGGASRDVSEHQAQIAIEGLWSYLDGQPVNVVNPDVLKQDLRALV